MDKEFRELLTAKLHAMEPFDAMEVVMDIYRQAFRNRHEKVTTLQARIKELEAAAGDPGFWGRACARQAQQLEKQATLIADVLKNLKALEKCSDDLARMISTAEYQGDELERGIAAWEPVANTMRNGFMASMHGMIQESIAAITKHNAPCPASDASSPK